MHRLQELVRLYRLGEGARSIARQLRMSPNTEREYRNVLKAAGLLEGDAESLPELAVLKLAIEAHKPSRAPPQHESSVERWREQVTALVAAGAAPKAIFDRLRLEHSEFKGSLSAIKRMVTSIVKQRGVRPEDVAIPVDTHPGQIAQVDFGAVGKLWDPEQKRLRKAYVFLMVLGFSRHVFARLVFDQKVETWLALHVGAFEWFGGVPETIVPDNLKAAVVRAAFDVRSEPVLNRSYRELARHFSFKIDPTPPFSPQKKGKVESGIRFVKGNFMRTVGDERDIEVLNRMLERWAVEVAGKRIHGTTHRRPLEVFEGEERETLRGLPTQRWEPVSWREPTVHRDCCVLIEKARYSVPWRLVGKKLLARVTSKSVEVYWEDARVATHDRVPAGCKRIKAEHLPPERGEYRMREQGYWVERAAALGEDVHRYIEEVFGSDDVLNQLTKVTAIVRHLETFPSERANAACKRASFFGCYGYGPIKEILRKGLDLEALPQVTVPQPTKTSSPRFARNVQELLDFTPNDPDASH